MSAGSSRTAMLSAAPSPTLRPWSTTVTRGPASAGALESGAAPPGPAGVLSTMITEVQLRSAASTAAARRSSGW